MVSPVDLPPAAVPIDPDPDPPSLKNSGPSSSGFLWKQLFESRPSPCRSYLPDGTPIVTAPPSVILHGSEAWTNYILCHFFGDPPSPAKFYADLNPIWGKKGNITVRRFSGGTFLVFVPSAGSRKWILDSGLWSSGTVSFFVTKWTVTSSLVASEKLTSAPTTLTLHGVPPQLWSQQGIEAIAEGVATLIPGARASLPISSLGTAKIRAIVSLGPALPPVVLVKDSNGGSVKIGVDYGRLPPLCPSCKVYGHLSHRCPSRRSETSQPQSTAVPVPLASEENPTFPVYGPSISSSPLPNIPAHHQSPLKSIALSEPSMDCSPRPTAVDMSIDKSSLSSPTPTDASLPSSAPNPATVTNKSLHPSSTDCSSSSSTIITQTVDKASSTAPAAAAPIQSSDPIPAPVIVSNSVSTDPYVSQVPASNTKHEYFPFPPVQKALLPIPDGNQKTSQTTSESTRAPLEQVSMTLITSEDHQRKHRKITTPADLSLHSTFNHKKFKPLGVVVKRSGKGPKYLLADSEIQEALQEMESHKKNSLDYELIATHKVITQLESESNSQQAPT